MNLPAVAALVLDVLTVVAVAAASAIVMSGGFEIHLGGLAVRARTVRNPALALAILSAVRAFLIQAAPLFLRVRHLDLRTLAGLAVRATAPSANKAAAGRRAALLAIAVIFAASSITLANAWVHFGFFSGDDVEIQEMSLSHLFGYSWSAWNLRNPFYPLVFVYPVQAIVHALGVSDPAVLVFSARAMVAAFAAVTMGLVFAATRREWGSGALAACAVTFLAANKLYLAFSSTELPRPVAAAFVVGSYFLLLRRGSVARAVTAGLVLGIGAALRFSEFVFIVPAVIMLALEGRRRDAIVVATAAVVFALAILGIADTLYWKQPFYSTANIVDYTLVRHLSSRGYQAPLAYLTSAPKWTDLVTLALALVGIRRAPKLALWFVLPLLLLSCLPHKEERYLIPMMPFEGMLAAVGLWSVMGWIASAPPGRARWHTAAAVALTGSLIVAVLLEAQDFRFRRSESAVEVARYLARTPGEITLAVEDTFRLGNTIYFGARASLTQIDPIVLRASPDKVIEEVKESRVQFVALADADVRTSGLVRALASLGFAEIDFGGRVQYERYRLYGRRPVE